jgi:hypothetical protein
MLEHGPPKEPDLPDLLPFVKSHRYIRCAVARMVHQPESQRERIRWPEIEHSGLAEVVAELHSDRGLTSPRLHPSRMRLVPARLGSDHEHVQLVSPHHAPAHLIEPPNHLGRVVD